MMIFGTARNGNMQDASQLSYIAQILNDRTQQDFMVISVPELYNLYPMATHLLDQAGLLQTRPNEPSHKTQVICPLAFAEILREMDAAKTRAELDILFEEVLHAQSESHRLCMIHIYKWDDTQVSDQLELITNRVNDLNRPRVEETLDLYVH